MSYMELIDKAIKSEMDSGGPELVREKMKHLNLDETSLGPENIPALAKAISEAVVSISTRDKARKIYWEMLKLLDIESIVAGTEDPSLKAAQLADMGDAASSAGEWDKAREYYEQMMKTGAPGVEPLALIKFGELCATRGEQDEAREYFKKAVEMCSETGNYLLEALALRGIGYTCWRLGEYPEAKDLLAKAIDVALQVDDQDMVAKLYVDMGLVLQSMEKYNEGIKKFQEAIDILVEIGNQDELARACNNFGEVYKIKGDLDQALEAYGRCVDAAASVKNERLKALALVNSAECNAKKGNLEEAKKMAKESMEILERIKDDYILSGAYLALAIVAFMEEKWDVMEENFGKEIGILKKLGYRQEVALSLIEYARSLAKKGDIEGARERYEEAREILVDISSTALVENIDKELEKLG